MGYVASGLSVAALLIVTAIPDAAALESGTRLDRCETKLSACYESCKASGTRADICNNRCSTDLCGLHWRESFGAFIDRRIEENAAPQFRYVFIGLSRFRRPVKRHLFRYRGGRERNDWARSERGTDPDSFRLICLLPGFC
jgi:hypothetical protein